MIILWRQSSVGEFTDGAFPVYVNAGKQKTQASYGGETCIFYIEWGIKLSY